MEKEKNLRLFNRSAVYDSGSSTAGQIVIIPDTQDQTSVLMNAHFPIVNTADRNRPRSTLVSKFGKV
jgi:hypothetical protein